MMMTRDSSNGCVLFTEVEGHYVRPSDMSDRQIKKALRRLAEYEDTGLEPEEIETLKRRYEDDKR